MDQCPSCGYENENKSSRPRPNSGVPYRSMTLNTEVKKISLHSRVKSVLSVLYLKTPSKIVNLAKVGGRFSIGTLAVGIPGFLFTWGLYQLGYVVGTYVFGIHFDMRHGPESAWPAPCWVTGVLTIAVFPLAGLILCGIYKFGEHILNGED